MVDPALAFEPLTQTQEAVLEQMCIHRVRFVVIGGYAVRLHGHCRPVHDLDLLVAPSKSNLERLREGLAALRAIKLDRLIQHLNQPLARVTFFDVEFFSSLKDLDTPNVFKAADSVTLALADRPRPVAVMSRPHLLAAKRLAFDDADRGEKRTEDLKDLTALTQ